MYVDTIRKPNRPQYSNALQGQVYGKGLTRAGLLVKKHCGRGVLAKLIAIEKWLKSY